MQSLSANKPNVVHQYGVFLLVLLLTASHLIKSNAADGIYLSPDSGTYDKDQVAYITASEAPAYVSPNGEQCCGGGQDGIYEFYDIEYTGWSGDVVDPSGNGAGLDTSSPGSKSVTCNGLMKFRCSGGEDIAGPVSVSGTGTYTVNDSVKANLSPSSNVYVYVNETQTFTSTPSNGSGNYSWTWFVDDEEVSSGDTYSTTWADPEQHEVKVQVTDVGTGKTDEATATVQVWQYKYSSILSDGETPSNERTILGILEDVQIWIEPSNLVADWSIDQDNSGAILSNSSGNQTMLTAGNGDGQLKVRINISAANGGANKVPAWTVKAPTGNDPISDAAYDPVPAVNPKSGAGMKVWLRLLPYKTNFSKLQIGEETCPAINRTTSYNPGMHVAWGPLAALNAASAWQDGVASYQAPPVIGAYDWDIPMYYVDGNGNRNPIGNPNRHSAAHWKLPAVGGSISKWGKTYTR